MISGKSYDFKTDIWSLGCIFYEMCTLQRAFEGNDYMNRIVKKPLPNLPSAFSKDMNLILLR